VQLDLDNKEMELIELRLLQGPKKSLHMAHLYETDSITEQEYFEVFTALQSSQHRIRKLEVSTYDDSEWGFFETDFQQRVKYANFVLYTGYA
jgi:hypothetical protein